MQRYFIYFAYDGTAYHGWQIQPNGISVQEVLQDALSKILRRKTEVVGAGRTDTGVHARLMVAHFKRCTPAFRQNGALTDITSTPARSLFYVTTPTRPPTRSTTNSWQKEPNG